MRSPREAEHGTERDRTRSLGHFPQFQKLINAQASNVLSLRNASCRQGST